MANKSANRLWRESGSELPFKQWLQGHNQMSSAAVEENVQQMNFDGDSTFTESLNSSVKDTIDSSKPDIKSISSYKSASTGSSNKVLGLDKSVLIFSTLLIAGSVGYLIFKRLKNKS